MKAIIERTYGRGALGARFANVRVEHGEHTVTLGICVRAPRVDTRNRLLGAPVPMDPVDDFGNTYQFATTSTRAIKARAIELAGPELEAKHAARRFSV